MKHLSLLLSLILFSPALFAKPTSINAKIEASLNQDILKYNIPGIAVSISTPTMPAQTFVAGFSDLKNHTPVTQNTLFSIGSITKSFTSVRILQLQQQGKLTLNDPLSKFAKPNTTLAQTLKKYPQLSTITLLELLTHNSGLADGENSKLFATAFAKNPKRLWNDSELIDLAMQQPPLFAPGTKDKYNYTNTDYILLSYVIEAITHASIAANMQGLFTQAKMNNAYYPNAEHKYPPSALANLAHGYIAANTDWPSMEIYARYPEVSLPGAPISKGYDLTALVPYTSYMGAASGGIITNTQNMLAWYQALFINKELISEKSLRALTQGVPTGQDFTYGLGVTIRSLMPYHLEVISHNGSEVGYQCELIFVKGKNIIIAIATNADNYDAVTNFNKGIPADLLKILLNPSQ